MVILEGAAELSVTENRQRGSIFPGLNLHSHLPGYPRAERDSADFTAKTAKCKQLKSIKLTPLNKVNLENQFVETKGRERQTILINRLRNPNPNAAFPGFLELLVFQ